MYKLILKEEKVTNIETIKLFVNGKPETTTKYKKESDFFSDEENIKLDLRARFIKTNEVICNGDGKLYELSWSQSYIYVILFFVVLLAIVLFATGDEYATSERIIVLGFGGAIVNFIWNDLLLLGRKISLKEVGEK